jgi:hypothetical protein
MLDAHDDEPKASAWSEALVKAEGALGEVLRARQAGPADPVEWADTRTRARQAFEAADAIAWQIRLHELRQTHDAAQE